MAYPLAAALLMGSAASALAAGAPVQNRLMSQAQDAGAVAAATPLTAMVWLKGHNEATLDSYVAQRYDRTSPAYHQWMSPAEVAGFGPTAQDVATAQASLRAVGLKIETVSKDGRAIKVSGTADKMQAAFGTTVHHLQANNQTFYAAVTQPKYQGAHPELIDKVAGLTNLGAQPFVARQIDLATGEPVPMVDLATAGASPLSSFTTDCFGPQFNAKMSGFGWSIVNGTVVAGAVADNFTGPTYLDPTKTTNRPFCGYTAQQVAAHYGMDQAFARGWTGKGETIVIVDAYGSPTIQADADAFSQLMGLKGLDNQNFQIVYPDGQPTTTDSGWGLETTLDVEWAHAMAPDANIVLVVAPSNDDAELAYAVQYTADHQLGSVISNSWGRPEATDSNTDASMFNDVFKRAAAEGISVNVATGDSGDNGVGHPFGAASVPANSPYATGIGGTSIGVPSDQGPVEAAWGITVSHLGTLRQPNAVPSFSGFIQGGGGGESAMFAKPPYQQHLPGAGRQLPDVSALADPQTGALVVFTDPKSGQQQIGPIGGTSLATPLFSGIWALANQAAGQSLGQAAPAVGVLPASAFNDIGPVVAHKNSNTFGSITFRGTQTTNYDPAQLMDLQDTQPDGFVAALVFAGQVPFQGWNVIGFGTDSSLRAGPGWDNATGYGVPNGIHFIEEATRLSRQLF
ncbi:serine protease [Aliidongia dinghuensis]|uniref:Serine protease n=1 Tax=Aliidongia dinghuensis TaxID=1867774 RepID=A0A8J2YWE0_9PROT|nr:serine protease [Aliidongia dinghuensis]